MARIGVQSTPKQTAKTTVYNQTNSIYYATHAHLAALFEAGCSMPSPPFLILFFLSVDTVFFVRYICTHFTFVWELWCHVLSLLCVSRNKNLCQTFILFSCFWRTGGYASKLRKSKRLSFTVSLCGSKMAQIFWRINVNETGTNFWTQLGIFIKLKWVFLFNLHVINSFNFPHSYYSSLILNTKSLWY